MTQALIKNFFTFLFSIFIVSVGVAQNGNMDSLKKVIRKGASDTAVVNAKIELAKAVIDSDLDSTLALASQAYNKSKEINYDRGLMAASNMLGNYYQRKSDFKKAISFYNESKKIAIRTNDLQGLAGAYNNMGIIYINQSQYPQALAAFLEGLKYEQQRGNKQGMAESYNNIAVVHYYQKDMETCAEYLKKSVDISVMLGDEKTATKGYNNIGAIYIEIKRYNDALVSFRKSEEICRKLNSKLDLSIAVENMAFAYSKKKDRVLAQKYYDETLAIKKELEDYNGLAIVYVSIGGFYQELGDLVKAEQYFKSALAISREKGFKDQEMNALKSLSEVYVLRKDYKRALEFDTLSAAVKDSVYNLEKIKSIQELQTKFETVEKEKALAQEKANVANHKLVIKNRNNTIILVSAGFIIFLIIAVGWYNRTQYRQRQFRKEVELKQLLAEAELKNKIQGERERISRDLHDHIGSQLTLMISGLDTMSYRESENDHKDAADRLNDLSDQARQTMGQLRETIWAMNKEEVSVVMLVSKIKEFTNKAHREINTEISGDGGVVISPAKSLALFRVCQEAINNAIKHAEFKTLNIHFQANKDQVDVLIKDDGKGFDMEEAAKRGYGLENMAFRVQECGGHFKMSSAPGQGTSIEMKIALN